MSTQYPHGPSNVAPVNRTEEPTSPGYTQTCSRADIGSTSTHRLRNIALCLGSLVTPNLAPSAAVALCASALTTYSRAQSGEQPKVSQANVLSTGAKLLPLLTLDLRSDSASERLQRESAIRDLQRAYELDYRPEVQARVDRLIERQPIGFLEKQLPTVPPRKVPTNTIPGSADHAGAEALNSSSIEMSKALGNVARGRVCDYHAKTGAWPNAQVTSLIMEGVRRDYEVAGLSGGDISKATKNTERWILDKAVGVGLGSKVKVGLDTLRQAADLSDAASTAGEKERAPHTRAALLREIEIANDPTIAADTNRHFQGFLLNAPQAAKAGIATLDRLQGQSDNSGYPPIQFAPDPDKFSEAYFKEQADKKSGILRGLNCTEPNEIAAAKTTNSELMSKAKSQQVQTEKAAASAVKSELSLSDSKAALHKKMKEIEDSGGDPDTIFQTAEFKNYEKAEKKHQEALDEFDKCVDQTGQLLARLDPKLGRVFTASVNLCKGLGKLSEGLSKIKFSDMLSVTNLAFALFDSFLGGPDPTQVKLDQIIKMIEGLDKKLDDLSDKIDANHRQIMARFDDIERGQASARWEANVYYTLLESQIRQGFAQIIDLQIETIRAMGLAHQKLDEIIANGQLSIGLLVKLQDGLIDLGDSVRSTEQDKQAAALEMWLENGVHPDGFAGLIADTKSLYSRLFTTVQLLSENALRKVELPPEAGLSQRGEVELFDFAMTDVSRRAAALYRCIKNDRGANVVGLYDYEKLGRYLSLVYRVTNNLGKSKLSTDELNRISLSPEQIASTRQLLRLARETLDSRMYEIQGTVFENIRRALNNQDAVTRTVAETPSPLGSAKLNFEPKRPWASLQLVADAEPMASVVAKLAPVFATPYSIDGGTTLSFRANLDKAQWLQAELVNEDDLQAKLSRLTAKPNTGGANHFSDYMNLNTAKNALRASQLRMSDVLLYAGFNSPEKPTSNAPRTNLLPFRRHGYWTDFSISGAHREAKYSWLAAIPYVFKYRASGVDIDVGMAMPHTEVQKQRLIGQHIQAGRPVISFERLADTMVGAEFEGVDTFRSFTEGAPGLPGEDIKIRCKQTATSELRPNIAVPIHCGDQEVGVISGSFAATAPVAKVTITSGQEFDLKLNFNGVPRPFTVYLSHGSTLTATNLHIEPAPLCQLLTEQKPAGRVFQGLAVPSNIDVGQEVDISPYLSEFTYLNDIASKSLAAYLMTEQTAGRITAEWRDGLVSWRAVGVNTTKNTSDLGIYQDGGKNFIRLALVHRTHNSGNQFLVDIEIVGAVSELHTKPSVVCQTKVNFLEARYPQSEAKKDSPFTQAAAKFIKQKLEERTADIVTRLGQGGSALQQARVASVTNILVLRRMFAAFGHEYFAHDIEQTAIRTGSIATALTNTWAGNGQTNRLLGLAGRMAAIESGQIKGEQLLALVNEARAELSAIEAQLNTARQNGARFGTPTLDLLESMFAPVQ